MRDGVVECTHKSVLTIHYMYTGRPCRYTRDNSGGAAGVKVECTDGPPRIPGKIEKRRIIAIQPPAKKIRTSNFRLSWIYKV